MAKMITNAGQLIGQLNALLALDYDAIEAYEAAIHRMIELHDKAQLTRFLGDHQRHLVDLVPLVRELGGEPTTKADFKRVLTKGRVLLGGMVGDRAVLEAMKTNEEMARKTYRSAIDGHELSDRIRAALERNLADEQRHLAWIEQRLSVALGAPAHH